MISGANAEAWGKVLIAVTVAIILGIILYYGKSLLDSIAEYFKRVGSSAFNPLSPDNVAVTAANTITEKLTGDPSLGGWIHDAVSLDPFSAEAIAAVSKPIANPPLPYPENPFFYAAP